MPPGIGYGPQTPQQAAPSYGASQRPGRQFRPRRPGDTSRNGMQHPGLGSYVLPDSYRVHPETGQPIMSDTSIASINPNSGQVQRNVNTPEAMAFAAEFAPFYATVPNDMLNQLAFNALNQGGTLSPWDALRFEAMDMGLGWLPSVGTPAYRNYVNSNPQFFGGL